ncbi:MAG TPA: sugar phosphate nucleotidyltransferase [Allosphingosinicella sp.]|nr:sugar phosphate nucleotidyltransferase [Allosphingosinicella sp.]
MDRGAKEDGRGGTRIVPVILSGGAGTRLWPLSRPGRPKQLLPLAEARTMLQLTLARLACLPEAAPPIIVAAESDAAEIGRQAAEAGVAPAALILEPVARNTAPAIALAALSAEPDDLLLVMPSDHVIARPEALADAVRAAAPLAAEGWLVTFGVPATAPETGYGYIRRGASLAPGVEAAAAFVEKPAIEVATALVASGDHAWNSGIFLFRAATILDALREFAPQVRDGAAAALAGGSRDGEAIRPDTAVFGRSPSISIDYAVMERAQHIAVAAADMGWSDVGSFEALYRIVARDGAGNSCEGDVLALGARDCLIRGEGVTVAAIDVEGLVIVATADAVLVARRESSQRVSEAARLLKERD